MDHLLHTAHGQFVRFAETSLVSTGVDQAMAWVLFSALRGPMAGSDLLRILVASVIARCCAVALNFTLNTRLVFAPADGNDAPQDHRSTRESLPRFVMLSAFVLGLSTLGVWWAHTALGAPEWMAKPVVDTLLFFVNYNAQRTWVFSQRTARAVAS